MKTLLLNVPSFSGKIVSPTWIKAVRDFQSNMHDIYSDNCKLKVYTGNCIIQLSADSKDLSESFFDVYDRDEMKMIYTIHNSILKEMLII